MVPETIEWCHPPQLEGVEVLRAERSPRLWRVFHEAYAICTPFDGASRWDYRAQSHYTTVGDLMLLEPGEVHATRVILGPRHASFKVIFIPPSVVAQAGKELGLRSTPPHLNVAGISDAVLFQAFARLHSSVESCATALECQTRLAACLRLFLERCAEEPLPSAVPKPPGNAALRRARDFLEAQSSDNVTLETLAEVTGLSRFHLAHAFKAQFGVPPHAYQLQVRLARARALLAGGMTAAAVAAQTGFADQSHLTRHFSRAFGVTPAAYAHAARIRTGQ